MSRPTAASDLVVRLRNTSTSDGERTALQILVAKMVTIFNERRHPEYIYEAAQISPVADHDSYHELLWAIIDTIAIAATSGRIIQPELCEGFVRVLRWAPINNIPEKALDMRLGTVLQSLLNALSLAVRQNELETQYQLVSTLAHVLDTMNDIKKRGISREALHEPLLKELDKISKDNKEIRLVQAAKYAYQALLGIPNDETPLRALLRATGTIVSGAGKIAGSASTMDPSKLLDGSTQDKNMRHQIYLGTWRRAVAITVGTPLITNTIAPTQSTIKSLFSRAKPARGYFYQIGAPMHKNKQCHPTLFSESWLVCPEAQLFYADIELRQHYLAQEGRLLHIERISGQLLPMEHCYINLAIVEQAKEESYGKHDRNSSLIQMYRDQDEAHVQLHKVFDPRSSSEKPARNYRRLLIRGRAGVGKTTLCKKIVYELTRSPVHSDFQFWTKRYDRVLWLPLRNLSRHKGGARYNLVDLVNDEYFARSSEPLLFAGSLGKHCSMDNGGRTLFLLDGLDEVSKQLEPEHEMASFIVWLLNRPDVIITCRPGCGLPNTIAPLDCELETIGFNPKQLQTYMEHAVGSPALVQDIQRFLYSQPALVDLFCIPVQLDAFCYTWKEMAASRAAKDDLESLPNASDLNSMTAIYKAVECRLWIKDIARVGKRFQSGEQITHYTARRIRSPRQIYRLARNEINFLQCLAFTGLLDGVIDFESDHCDRVQDHLGLLLEDGLLDDILADLSFLRLSDMSKTSDAPQSLRSLEPDAQMNTYHFLHLTYQEFFAAQYFVKHWDEKSLSKLACPTLSGRMRNRYMDIENFVQKNKYNHRYKIFWQFVAGLLGDDNERCERSSATVSASDPNPSSPLAHFFQSLEKAPRDLLGPTHQRLIIRCLSEADPLQNNPLFDSHRGLLQQWILRGDSGRQGNLQLARFPGFPHRVYNAVLDDEAQPKATRDAITRYLCYSQAALNMDFLERMAEVDPDNYMFIFASVALRLQPVVPPNLTRQYLAYMKDPVPHSKADIIATLACHLDDILPEVMNLLRDPVPEVREDALILLQKGWDFSQPLPKALYDILVPLMADSHSEVSRLAFHTLVYEGPALEVVTDPITRLLQSPLDDIRHKTLCALPDCRYSSNRDALSHWVSALVAIFDLLQDPFEATQSKAAQILRQMNCQLPGAVFPKLALMLQSPDRHDRLVATEVLGGTSIALSRDILEVLYAQVDDKEADPSLCNASIEALEMQTLPKHILDALVLFVRTDCPDGSQSAAALALQKTTLLPPQSILEAVLRLLDDADERVQIAAASSLERTDLADQILVSVVQYIGTHGKHLNSGIVDIFTAQNSVSSAVLEALISRYEQCIRDTADGSIIAKILSRHMQILSKPDLERLAVIYEQMSSYYLMSDEKSSSIRFLADILYERCMVTPGVLKTALDQLRSQDTIANKEALTILSSLPLLSDDALLDLVSLAQSNSQLRDEALRTLCEAKNLPAAVLSTLLGGFQTQSELGEAGFDLVLYKIFDMPDDEVPGLLQQDEQIFQKLHERLISDSNNHDIVWYEESDTHYTVILRTGAVKRFPKAGIPAMLERSNKALGVPKGLEWSSTCGFS